MPCLWHCFHFGPMLRHRLSYLLIIVMYPAYLYGFGHDGPFVGRNHFQHTSVQCPDLLASLCLPIPRLSLRRIVIQSEPQSHILPGSAHAPIDALSHKGHLLQTNQARCFRNCEASVAGSSAHLSWKDSTTSVAMQSILR